MKGKRFPPRWAKAAPSAGLLFLCFLWSLSSLRIDLLPSLTSQALPPTQKQALPFAMLAIAAALYAVVKRQRPSWQIGALENLLSLGLFEIVGQKGEFYRLTGSGYQAADLLNDFARWPASQVMIEVGYVGAPADSLTLPCSGIVQLPATYYEVRVRPDVDVMRSEKEPKSLLIEGIPLGELNQIAWKPNHITCVDTATNESKSFCIERADNRKVAKFYLTS